MNLREVLVTPEMAAGWLETIDSNRRISRKIVSDYATCMSDGRWMQTAETIKFNGDGTLIDGQHRLRAVVKSDTSQLFVIAEGLDKAVFAFCDTGKKRSLGDLLTISGVEKFQPILAGVTTYWYKYCRDGLGNMDFNRWLHKVNIAKRLEFYESHPEILLMVLFVRGLGGDRIASPPVTCFWYGIFREVHEEKAKEFISKLIIGNSLAEDDPILRFRTKALGWAAKKETPHLSTIMILLVKTWNLWVQDLPSKSLQAHYGMKIPPILNPDGFVATI